jgi:hypothetical protein
MSTGSSHYPPFPPLIRLYERRQVELQKEKEEKKAKSLLQAKKDMAAQQAAPAVEEAKEGRPEVWPLNALLGDWRLNEKGA